MALFYSELSLKPFNSKDFRHFRGMLRFNQGFIIFFAGGLLFISVGLQRSNEQESMISKLELRRARLLKHCLTQNSSQEPSVKKVDFVGSPEASMKNIHYVRNLPEDLIFCLLKKGGSTSLEKFFTSNLDFTDEAVWYAGEVDKEAQEQIVLSRSSVRVIVIRHPFTRLVSAFNHLFRWGLEQAGNISCSNTTNSVGGCENEWPYVSLAQEIIKQTRPGSNDTRAVESKSLKVRISLKVGSSRKS